MDFISIIVALLAGAAAVAVVSLVVLTLDAIVATAREWWDCGTTIVILEPSVEAELARLASENGAGRHKRFVVNTATGERRLVESDTISHDLDRRKRITVTI